MKKLLFITFLVICGFGLYVVIDVGRGIAQVKDSLTCRPGTLGYEIDAGIVGFYQIAKRLPQSKADLIAGLDRLKIKPSKLSALRSVKFSRRNRDTIIKYETEDGFEGELAFSDPFTENPAKK